MADLGVACSSGEKPGAEPAHELGHGEGDETVDVEYGQPADWQRFYLGYKERFVDDCVLELQGGRTRVRLAQAPSARVANKKAAKASSKGMDMDSDPALTGTTVWDGAVVLAHFLTETDTLSRHMQDVIAAEAADAAAAAAAAAAKAAAAAAEGTAEGSTAAASPVAGEVSAPKAGLPAAGTPVSPVTGAGAASMPTRQPCQAGPSTGLLLRPVRLPTQPRQAKCLELGAGTGAVSLALLACRCVGSVTITDIPDLLPHLTQNVTRNASLLDRGRAHVLPLRWGPPGDDITALPPAASPPYDLVVGSDLIYYSYSKETPHSELLVWTLQRVCGPRTLIVLALSLHHNAPEVHSFLKRCERAGFAVQRLKAEVPEAFRVPDVMLVRLRYPQQACKQG